MKRHHKLMYGLSLSPILADFQKTPIRPVLFLSRMAGKIWWTWAHVQIRRRITRRSDWRLKRADILSVLFLSIVFRFLWFDTVLG